MATEKRLIDVDKFKRKMKLEFLDRHNKFISMQDLFECIDDMPTVDAAKLVHARWEQGDMYDYGDVCSACDWDSSREPCRLSYCPNCGAKMDGGV